MPQNQERIARAMQEARDYDFRRPPAHMAQEPEIPEHLLPSFQIHHHSKVAEWFGTTIIEDALEHCPQPVKKDIDALILTATVPSLAANAALKKGSLNRLILVGPPGSGKTTLAQAIAYATKRPFVFVKSSELSSEYKHAFRRIIDHLFHPMIGCKQPGVIIFDEFTAFTKKFDNKNDADTGAVQHLWMKLDEAKRDNPQLLVICTANDVDGLPETIHSRFSGKKCIIDQPTRVRKKEIITKLVSTYENHDPKTISYLLSNSKNLSLRELSSILEGSHANAIIRAHLQEKDICLTQEDIDPALHLILKEHSERLWKARKEKIKSAIATATPYAIGIALTGAGLYLTYTIYKKQSAQAQQNHDASLNLQRTSLIVSTAIQKKFHSQTESLTKTLHEQAAKQAKRFHMRQIKLSRQQYDDSHGYKQLAKQTGGQAAAGILVAVVNYYLNTKLPSPPTQ